MVISVTNDYGVSTPQGNLLGNIGENKLRKIKIFHPKFENGVYILKFAYNDGIIYECLVENGEMCVDGSLLRYEGEVNAQFFAYVSLEGQTDLVFESEIFALRIGACLDGEVTAIPTYEQSEDMLNKLIEEFSSLKVKSGSIPHISTMCNISQNIYLDKSTIPTTTDEDEQFFESEEQ